MNKVFVSGVKLEPDEIEKHLISLGSIFIARLRKKIKIWDYALKLSSLSTINVIKIDEEIAAMVAFYFNEEIDMVYISHIGVSPQWQKRGFAYELIQGIEREKPCRGIRLEVSKDNFLALTFYKKLGFSTCEILENSVFLERVRNESK